MSRTFSLLLLYSICVWVVCVCVRFRKKNTFFYCFIVIKSKNYSLFVRIKNTLFANMRQLLDTQSDNESARLGSFEIERDGEKNWHTIRNALEKCSHSKKIQPLKRNEVILIIPFEFGLLMRFIVGWILDAKVFRCNNNSVRRNARRRKTKWRHTTVDNLFSFLFDRSNSLSIKCTKLYGFYYWFIV